MKALISLPDLPSKFIPEFDTLFLALPTLPSEQLTGSAVAAALRTLQVADAPREELAAMLREVVEYLESLQEASKPEWRRPLQYLFLLIHHKRDPWEQPELNRMSDPYSPLYWESMGIAPG